MKHISSVQNQSVKRIIELQSKAKARKESNCFTVEGLRELQLAFMADYEATHIYWCPDILTDLTFKKWISKFNLNSIIISVSIEVYNKMVIRSSTEGVIGILKQKNIKLEDWQPKNNCPFLLVLESIEKPGNLGAILRTADASGVDAVIVSDPHTDIYNPNVIRSSVGGFFSVLTFVCENKQTKDFLKNFKINIYAASLQKSIKHTDGDFTKATAFVMGSEAKGLSAFWLKESTAIKIPMLGHVDSLNVSVATAILAYEVVRQRKS
ncbi:MAG: TrmH family RNA methyltransferase [Flavobacteriaceae bacterium]|jgi:TrmH family RNA methyltransferase|tara:strand:+ start:5203 stop:6000 length:798 start_codon:yes stop_codon:yes gene_type:complete